SDRRDRRGTDGGPALRPHHHRSRPGRGRGRSEHVSQATRPQPDGSLPEGADRMGVVHPHELLVSGMTCASCAVRIERLISRQRGVQSAEINYATARGRVAFDPASTDLTTLIKEIERIGYHAEAVVQAAPGDAGASAEERAWLRRVALAWPLGIVVFALLLLDMGNPWARWAAAALTVPIQFWAGWPFLHTAAIRARNA